MDRLVDLTGPVYNGMWHLPEPYFAPRVEELGSTDWLDYPIYAQALHAPLQVGTYLETAANLYPDREMIADVPLDRLVMTPALCVRMPRQRIFCDQLMDALGDEASNLSGVALLIETGWGHRWSDPEFLSQSPHFSSDLIEFVAASDLNILGSDACRWDDWELPQNHLPTFFSSIR